MWRCKILITFNCKDAIKYYDIFETTDPQRSYSVLVRSLQEQDEAARNNAVCLDKLLMSSSDMVIVTDTYRLQLDTTDDLVKFEAPFHL